MAEMSGLAPTRKVILVAWSIEYLCQKPDRKGGPLIERGPCLRAGF